MLSFSDPNPLFLQNQSEGGDRSNKTLTSFGCQDGQTACPDSAEKGCVSWDLWS